MNKGLLVILSGPSGVGKGTVRNYIFEKNVIDLFYSISMTTRLPRNGEVDGKEYYFVSKDVFEENIKKGNLLEHAFFVGNYYGTPKDKVEELRSQGKNVFLEIEINGATQVLDKVKDDGVISFFLMPPSLEDLETRIRGRKSEDENTIRARINKARSEMEMTDRYDYVIVNDKVEKAGDKIIKILLEKINGKGVAK